MEKTPAEARPAAQRRGTEGYIKYADVHPADGIWQGGHMTDAAASKQILRNAVKACWTNKFRMYLHDFGKCHGVEGFAVPSGSSISIRFCPESEYTSFDISCGAEISRKSMSESLFSRRANTISTCRRSKNVASRRQILQSASALECTEYSSFPAI